MMVLGIILHGACYDFVYVASQVYIEQKASKEIRAQAQGFFVLVSYGVGQGLGTLTAGWIFNSIMQGHTPSMRQWQEFWFVPLIFSLVVTVLFILGFNERAKSLNKNI
jgi:MFS family permease